MSPVTIVENTGQQAHFDYDTSKIFVWKNRYASSTLLNDSGGILSYLPGTLLGRITASGLLAPLQSGAVDGRELFVGVLKSQINDLADTGQALVNYATEGDVVIDRLIFDGADDLDTTINGRAIRDIIADMGINLVNSAELTDFDNQ